MALKTCKWHQIVRLVKTRRLLSTVTFLSQILNLTYLGHKVPFYILGLNLVTSILTEPKQAIYQTCRFFQRTIKCRLLAMVFEI